MRIDVGLAHFLIPIHVPYLPRPEETIEVATPKGAVLFSVADVLLGDVPLVRANINEGFGPVDLVGEVVGQFPLALLKILE